MASLSIEKMKPNDNFESKSYQEEIENPKSQPPVIDPISARLVTRNVPGYQ